MTYQMKLDEMVDVFRALKDRDNLRLFVGKMEALGDEMAAVIAAKLNVQVGSTSSEESAFAGTCCPFFPSFKGQTLPEAMEGADNESEWEDSFDTAPDLPEGFTDWPFLESDVAPNDVLEILMPDGQRATGTAVEAIRIPYVRAWRKVPAAAPATEGESNG